jgi:hypothetical protein
MTRIADASAKINPPSPSVAKIEVLDLRLVSQGNIRAYARVRVGALVIAGVKVVQQPGQRAYVRLPDQQNPTTGKWFPIVNCISPTLQSAIDGAVLDAWRDATVLGLGRGAQ